jgi:nitroimidazol reductase NimA-like FMN-containing flavoprotein (pyridoxamine 5'-phosphate oxidase superfamily)
MRLSEREIKDKRLMNRVLARNGVVTLAMSQDNRPYLVTLNYAYDQKPRHLYFHCASSGKKLDYLVVNPSVWGQVMEDMGYIEGKCDYSYRTVHFLGDAGEVLDPSEKSRALTMMIEKFDRKPEAMKTRLLRKGKLEKVRVFRVKILEMTGKESLPRKI